MHIPLVVLGGGPGGYAAAFLAADLGMPVAIVEMDSRLGGTCLLRGCIPSKALLHVAKVLGEAKEMQEWGVDFQPPKISLDALRARKEKVISTLTGGLSQLAKRRNVQIINAKGTFENSQTLRLEGGDPSTYGGSPTLTFDHCIVAVGSRPAVPPAFNVSTDRVMDSTGALELKDIPQTMLVVGGGYIGLEMGTVYAHLGTKVTVVELMDGLLPGADRDLVKPLQKKLGETLHAIQLNTKVASLTDKGSAIDVELEGPSGKRIESFERVLVSIGRRPNSNGIGLENTRAKVNERGFIEVDKAQRTADPHILAIGDVAGDPMLAHKASHEGRIAVEALHGHASEFDKLAIPAVVFTDPEIAWAGLTETQAKAAGREVEVVQYPWAASGRAIALGRTEGLTKMLVDPDSERVLGVGICGAGAGELIAEAVLAIEMGCSVRDITESIHPHPTLSETVGFVGEVFYGTATEVYKPRKN